MISFGCRVQGLGFRVLVLECLGRVTEVGRTPRDPSLISPVNLRPPEASDLLSGRGGPGFRLSSVGFRV